MTGEEKRLRSKKCLSRTKRSNKTENEQSHDSVGEYPALRSRGEPSTGSAGVVPSELKEAGAPSNHIRDAFDFDDDDDDNGAVSRLQLVRESTSNKRKRLDPEEDETSSSNNLKSKFKRVCKAVNNAKQSSVPLQEYKDNVSTNNRNKKTKACIERPPGNKESVGTENMSGVVPSPGTYSNVAKDQMPQTQIRIQNKVESDTGSGSVCNANVQIHNDINQLHDGEGISQKQVCPVCGLAFALSHAMDDINEHINSCLDKGSSSSSDPRTTGEMSSVAKVEWTNGESNDAAAEVFGEDLFFCHLCQKDLSKMNSQRRQQHINRCCDQSAKTEGNKTSAAVQAQGVNQLQCPICGKAFKSLKSRQSHIKKCAQQFGVGTNQLLEIVRRERQCDEATASAAVRSGQSTGLATGVQHERKTSVAKRKRKDIVAQRGLDEETQLALALSVSMAPPPPAANKRNRKGKRNKDGNELPALLLRNDEEAQKAVAMRAAQVLCLQDDDDDDDEISCTPALAPSHLIQNKPVVQSAQQLGSVEAEDSKQKVDAYNTVNQKTRAECKNDKHSPVQEDDANEATSDVRGKWSGDVKECILPAVTVDPALSKSFLNSLYDDEVERNETTKPKVPSASPLWSLAADKHQSSERFYVPGLLPPQSPRRVQTTVHQRSPSTSSVKTETSAVRLTGESQSEVGEGADSDEINEGTALTKRRPSSARTLKPSIVEDDMCMEITPTQAVNVDMLLELAGDDDLPYVSMETQPVSAASGFCVDKVDGDAAVSGETQLLQDLSSMVNNSYLSDVVIALKDGCQVMAHSFMLSLRSEVLAQMLNDGGGTAESGDKGRVYLKFEDVNQSAFECVLRHIYTGDVSIPQGCDVDSVACLAERLKLPCLLGACRAEQSVKLIKDRLSQEDDVNEEFNTTDLDKLEEDLWSDGNEDEFDKEWDTTKYQDGNDDCLNEDDIEEILIFQTQSLKRADAKQCEDAGGKSSETFLEHKDLSHEEQYSDVVMEEERLSSGKSEDERPTCEASREVVLLGSGDEAGHPDFGLGKEQPFPREGESERKETLPQLLLLGAHDGNMQLVSRDFEEKRESRETVDARDEDLARDNKEEVDMLCDNRDSEVVMLRDNRDSEVVIMRDSREAEVVVTRGNGEAEEVMLRDSREAEVVMSCDDGKAKVDILRDSKEVEVVLSRHNRKADVVISRDIKETEVFMLRDSKTERACVKCHDRINDSGDVEAPAGDHVQGMCWNCMCKANNEDGSTCVVGGNLLGVKKAVKEQDELQDGIDSFYNSNSRMDLEVETETHTTDDIDSSVVDRQKIANEKVLSPGDSKEKTAEVRNFLTREERCWNEEEEEEGSPGEEPEMNESITLISDNDEEVVDVSPPPSNICVVPETPRVSRKPTKHVTKDSSSTASTNDEDDDICVTGSSPSKSREQLNVEASEFLSKLKQRADRGKSRVKSRDKRKNRSGETSPSTTPSKKSPRRSQSSNHSRSGRQDKSAESSPSSGRTPPRCRRSADVSPISSRDCCVPEVVAVEQSPPLSPVLLRVRSDSPQTSKPLSTERPTADFSGRENTSDVEEVGDMEIIGDWADNPADTIYGDIALSTSSSPRDVMSPPVPSPNYSFLDPVFSPETPANHASPVSRVAHLARDSNSSNVPLRGESSTWKRQGHSPVSPSVCSFSSEVATVATQEGKKAAVRNFLRDGSFDEHVEEGSDNKNEEIRVIDPNMSLRGRLKAAKAHGLGRRVCGLKNEDTLSEDDSNTKRASDYGDESEGKDKGPLLVSSQHNKETTCSEEENEAGNVSMDEDLDFYDDGGYNYDMEELNNLEVCYQENNMEEQKQARQSDGEEMNNDKVYRQETKPKPAAGGEKMLPSQSRGQEVNKKRGKRTDKAQCKKTEQTIGAPVTPMPNYHDMATPVLKSELHKFGVRPLPKKKMILKLKEIYDYTHQGDSDSQEAGQPLSSDDVVSDVVDGMPGSGTASSDNSDEEDTEFGDCTVLIEDEAITMSQQVNGGNLKDRLLSYIRNNEDLYRNILHYKPLELVSVHQQIKSDGINCPLGKLVDFLDQQCITFTTAGSRTRTQKRRGRKKKEAKQK